MPVRLRVDVGKDLEEVNFQSECPGCGEAASEDFGGAPWDILEELGAGSFEGNEPVAAVGGRAENGIGLVQGREGFADVFGGNVRAVRSDDGDFFGPVCECRVEGVGEAMSEIALALGAKGPAGREKGLEFGFSAGRFASEVDVFEGGEIGKEGGEELLVDIQCGWFADFGGEPALHLAKARCAGENNQLIVRWHLMDALAPGAKCA